MRKFQMKAIAIALVSSLLLPTELAACGKNATENASGKVTQKIEENASEKENESTKKNEEINQAEEARKKEEFEKQAEAKKKEEAEKQAAEEAKKKEEAEKQAAEEAKKKEEAEKQTEEIAKTEEEKKLEEQKNSFAVMSYLAVATERIRVSKNSRLLLDEIYAELINDINPEVVDEITQRYLQELRENINTLVSNGTKRERLQILIERENARNIQKAIASSSVKVARSLISFASKKENRTVRTLLNAGRSVADIAGNLIDKQHGLDMRYLWSSCRLFDEEVATIMRSRDQAFDYMVDMVRKYKLEGKSTYSEKEIERFVEISAIESVSEKMSRLEAEKETYSLLGQYWLELADCKYESGEYRECIDDVAKYRTLTKGIFRKDRNYARILTKAILAVPHCYDSKEAEKVIEGYLEELLANCEKSDEDWALRYFAAQAYMALFSETNRRKYKEDAYKIISENVDVLMAEQRRLTEAYVKDVETVSVEEPDYSALNETEKKAKKSWFTTEKDSVTAYNKMLKENRKTELPPIYEPFVLNCEYLFYLANELDITKEEQERICKKLQTKTYGIFTAKPLNDLYSFDNTVNKYEAKVTKDEIIIPANLLTADSTIRICVYDTKNNEKTFYDSKVTKVDRKGDNIDTFEAHVKSESFSEVTWKKDMKLKITIVYNDALDKEYSLSYRVSNVIKPKGLDTVINVLTKDKEKVVFVQE